jgi:hypothetical protein
VATIRFKLENGEVWEVEEQAGKLGDEVAFERQFKMSAAVVGLASQKAQQYGVAAKAAEEAGEEPPDMDPGMFPRTEWIAFFAWRQLRREHPGVIATKFETFVDSVDEMEYFPDEEDEKPAESEDPEEQDDVAVTGEDDESGLDPTEDEPDPAIPDPPPTPPQSFSSTESAGTPSS